MPTATWPMPGQESSQVRSAQRARSYEGSEHSLDVAEVAQGWGEDSVATRKSRRRLAQDADASDFRLLRLDRKRRGKQTDSEHDHEPDPPHGHLGWDGWRESS